MADDKTKTDWEILSVSVTPETAEELRRLAKQNQRSLSAEIRIAITAHLREEAAA